MADVQHTNLTSTQVHEPKHISTALTSQSGMVITPSSSTAGTSELRRLTAQDLDADNSTSFLSYWGFYEDSTYTSGSPRTISSGVRTPITIDGLGAGTNLTQMPVGVDLWDTSTNVITPEDDGDLLICRASFATTSAASTPNFDIDIDIGGAVGVIFEETRGLIKGTSTEQRYCISWHVYADSVILANGGTINITPSANIDFYDFGILLGRVHKGS